MDRLIDMYEQFYLNIQEWMDKGMNILDCAAYYINEFAVNNLISPLVMAMLWEYEIPFDGEEMFWME